MAGAPFIVASGPGRLAYLLTFPTYGTWLHGDTRGSVDRRHNVYGTPFLPPNLAFERQDRRQLKSQPFLLDQPHRRVVRAAILETAQLRGWHIHEAAVRTNHVHVVISAPQSPERVMNSLKSWATRRMIETGCAKRQQPVWVRHGSTRYLWKMDDVLAACRYVREGQGDDLPE